MHLEVSGILKVGPVFSNKFDPVCPHNWISWKLMHSKSPFPRVFFFSQLRSLGARATQSPYIGLLVCVPKLSSQAVVTWYFGHAI